MSDFLHPAARILVWCGWAVAVEIAALPQLYLPAVVSATAFVFPRYRAGAWQLLRRTRWLMLVLLLTYAYTLEGHLLWPNLDWMSPTVEGLRYGAERLLRLGLILVALAIMLVSTERARLVYGLYVLARPPAGLGFDRRAFAVRLGLTLEYVETAQPTPLLQRLREPFPVLDAPTRFSLAAERWHISDSLALLVALTVVLMMLT